MNRMQCEHKLMKKLEEAIKIYHEYNPNGDYLSLSYLGENKDKESNYYIGTNQYWSEDEERRIQIHVGL